MDNQVEEIKQKLDIINVVSRYLTLKKRGRHYLACCPFHNEKTPSFTVSPELQIYKCFGCGKAGDMFSFVQEYERVDFREALEELAKQAGITLKKNENLTQEEAKKKVLIEINKWTSEFYHYVLTKHPAGKAALDYVLNRGITLDTIKKFKIGFAPQNPVSLTNFLFKKGYKAPQLIATGTFGDSRYGSRLYDRFQNRLVFPLTDYRDRVVGFSGRVLPGSPTNMAKYINSPETEIYHKSHMLFGLNLAKEAIRKNNFVLVVEGEFDMISPYQIGIENVVALKGTAFTQDQLQLLRRYTDTLILGLDSDFAGNNAARKSIEMADNLGFDIQVLVLDDKFKDPDEAIKSDPEHFRTQLKNTTPVWDFLIQSALKANDPSTIRGKKEILSTVLPFLVKITNNVIKSDYFKKLADSIGSDIEAVHQESLRIQDINKPVVLPQKPEVKEEDQPVSSKTDKYESALLSLIFGSQRPLLLAQKISKHLQNFTVPKYGTIIKTLLESSDFEAKAFQQSLPAELRPTFESIYLTATSMEIDSHHRLLEIKKTINQIEIIILKEQLGELSRKIAVLENQDKPEELHQIELEFNLLLQKLSRLQTKKS